MCQKKKEMTLHRFCFSRNWQKLSVYNYKKLNKACFKEDKIKDRIYEIILMPNEQMLSSGFTSGN